MGLPKRKNNIDVYPGKTLYERRKEILSRITDQDSKLPEPVLHSDLDKGFLDFAKENFQFELSGNQLNFISKLLTIQRWGEISSSSDFLDNDEKLELPFVSIIRRPDTQFGTNPALQYTIPNRRPVYYKTVKNFDGNRIGADVYQIPQPIPLDVFYDVYIVSNRLREINEFNRKIMREFSSRQNYVEVKGHYIPVVLEGVNDESPISNTEKRRYYMQVYNFNLLGFLIDDEEFKVTPAINRNLLVTELSGAPLKTKLTDKKSKVIRNLNVFTETFLSDGKTTSFTTKNKLNLLIYVSYNGQVLLQDVDFFHNHNTSNIILNFKPEKDSELIINYSNNTDLTDVDGNFRTIVYENFNIVPNQDTLYLNYTTDSLLFLDLNGQIQNQGVYYDHIPNTNEIKILKTSNYNDNIQVKYIPITNATPGMLSDMDLVITNFTITDNTTSFQLTGHYIIISNVTVNNVPFTKYTFNNKTLTFDVAPPIGSSVRIMYYVEDNINTNLTPYDFYTDTFLFDPSLNNYKLTYLVKDIIFVSINGLIVNTNEIILYDKTNNTISFEFLLFTNDEITIKYLIDN